MIIFLYGQDSYRISQKLKELTDGYKAKNPSGLNFISLDCEEQNAKDLAENLKSNSLIPEKKLVVVKNILKTDAGKLLELFAYYNLSKSEEVILIVTGHAADEKNELFNYLMKRPNLSSKFDLLAGAELKSWIKNRAKVLGAELDGEALDYLVENVGSDLWRQNQELLKLTNYKNRGIARLADIQTLVSPKQGINVFDLTDALGQKNMKRALVLWHKAIDSGEEPIRLLALLAWHVRNLIKVKNAGANLKNLGLHPYVLEKTARQARFFQDEELKAVLKKIGDLDLAFKTSELTPKAAFLELVYCLS